MPIVTNDLKLKLSIKTGTAGNQNAQGNPNNSLGKYISTTEIVDATLNNLFDDVSGDENAAEEDEYRCIFLHNTHATLTLQNTVVWIDNQVTGGANITIAIDDLAASAIGSSSAQAAEIVNENTAPSGVGAFSAPTTKETGLSLGNVGPGQCRAIWIKRTTTNSGALNNDGATIAFEGETAA